MGGGLMQLVAYGAQDIYLTGNPQITFFKVVYRRHTNFSMECIQQTFNGQWGVGASNVTATISRNGDLISNMHLDIAIQPGPNAAATTQYANWTNSVGHAIIDNVELEIGGQMIDKHYGHWLDVWRELTDHDDNEVDMVGHMLTPRATYIAKRAQIGNVFQVYGVANNGPNTAIVPSCQLYVPLKFWFNRNPGLALPLIALQYHEVKVKIATRALVDLTVAGNSAAPVLAAGARLLSAVLPTGQAPVANLWVDYIYLDTDERRRFAQQSHEYLIEQVQWERNTLTQGGNSNVRLNLNHPVKELIWTVQDNRTFTPNGVGARDAASNDFRNLNNINNVALGTGGPNVFANADGAGTRLIQGNDYFNYNVFETTVGAAFAAASNIEYIGNTQTVEGFGTAQLKLNGHDRFPAKKASYFRTVTATQAGHRQPRKNVYVYSFALKPEEHQPSGTCNFSRIDNAQLALTNCAGTVNAVSINVYAVNYNVLRIMSGMGGLAYSN
jgi:hypothetical protein